jgi:transcriptional regulator with XRE-family HTH domain
MFPIGRGQLVRVPPDALKARRADLRWTQTAVAEKAGVSLATINLMERQGRDNYQTVTKAVVEDAIGWAPGSIDKLLAGGDATVVDEPPPQPGPDIAGPGFVAEVKQSEDLPDLLDQMPAAMRALWERMATGIAAELVAVSGQNPANDLTISDEALTTRTEFGDTYLAHTADTAPEKEQVEKATVQLQQALELLRPHTRRSVR